MKSLLSSIVVLVMVHVLALGCFVGWLWVDGRLNQARVMQVVEIFKTTLKQSGEQAEMMQSKASEKEKLRLEQVRLENVAQGPTTTTQRLGDDEKSRELVLKLTERYRRELKDMTRHIEFSKNELAAQKKQLDQERKVFDLIKEKLASGQNDKDFQQAIETYEGLKPKQTKAIFMMYIENNMKDQVVEYLAAMQLRKRAAVLNEFKSDKEVAVAAKIMMMLRGRGAHAISENMTKAKDQTL